MSDLIARLRERVRMLATPAGGDVVVKLFLNEITEVVNALEAAQEWRDKWADPELARQSEVIERQQAYLEQAQAEYQRIKAQTCMCRFDKAAGEGEPDTVPSNECEYHRALRAELEQAQAENGQLTRLCEFHISEAEKQDDLLLKTIAAYRHAMQSAYEPGCDCATCAIVRGEFIDKKRDKCNVDRGQGPEAS